MMIHKQPIVADDIDILSEHGRAGTFGAFLQNTLEQKFGERFHSLHARGIAVEAGFGDEQTWRNWMDSKTLPRAGLARQKLAAFLGIPDDLLELIIIDSIPRQDDLC